MLRSIDADRALDRAPERAPERGPERGVALILVLIFTVLLYALVAELVTRARTDRLTGENDALLARMQRHMEYSLSQVEEMLLSDLAAAAGSQGGEGGDLGAMGALGGAGGAGAGGDPGAGAEGAAGAEGEEEPDASALADCSQDAWFEPTAYSDGDLTTYVWVEDENRKFNILAMVSPDEEFAHESRQRFVRLIDVLREDTQFDLSTADGEMLADRIVQWIERRTDTEYMPRPPLKSDTDERPDLSVPLHLDELMMLRDITPDLFFDKVLDSRVIPGLESVLTVYTSLRFDPGDPDRAAARGAVGVRPDPGAPEQSDEPEPAESGPQGEPEQPEGVGIRININTAPPAVLRCLFPPSEVPDAVIEAILRFRNEPVEEEDGEVAVPDDYLGDIQEGFAPKKKVFTEVEQLEEIPEFENLHDPGVKRRFYELISTQSDVFSIHMASMFRRNEENRVFVISRLRSIMVRIDDEEEGKMHPLILNEERHGLRLMQPDLPDEKLDRFNYFDEMDDFTQEERAWNPFYLDFYRPPDERNRLFSYSDRR